ncbi:MAG: transposase [Sedimenticola sp.]
MDRERREALALLGCKKTAGPRQKAVKMIKAFLWGILNAIVLKVSNGSAEGVGSCIKMIKVRS